MSDRISTRDPQLEQFLAKQEITEVLYRYCRGLDRADWELLRSCYHDDAMDERGEQRGVDETVEYLKQVTIQLIGSSHSLTNILITVDGDHAGSESKYRATIGLPAGASVVPDGGVAPIPSIIEHRYVDRFERRNNEWRIAHRLGVWDWSEGNLLGAYDPGPGAAWGRRDRSDPSYAALELR